MRLRVVIRGAVQGVGFRPFIYRLASELGLTGWVNNSNTGVFVEVEGEQAPLERFLLRIEAEKPPHSSIQSLEPSWLDDAGFDGFEIRESVETDERTALILPDIATCPDCLREVFDPNNRRHLYPFTNCTHCGPRYSIIEALPYDRQNTSMKRFTMCEACRREYEDPANRRFHAQPNACPECGPRLRFWGRGHEPEAHDALLAAARAIRDGAIVAVKGLGGFHLMCLAKDDRAVRELRERKRREEKPFAVMFPSLDAIREHCAVSKLERRLLESPECPIVLLRRASSTTGPPSRIPASVAPANPMLGAMLPYTPLHHILLREVGAPLVATSGNLSDEPICIDEQEAREKFGQIADCFLVHNRPIVRHVDDSIVRVMAGREMVLRRARGYAPLPVGLKRGVRSSKSEVSLAVGAHLKSAVALTVGPRVFISQHIGDLETEAAYDAFERVGRDLQRLYGVSAAKVVADAHPDYLSTKFAEGSGLPVAQVQHHVAHVLSCMAENELKPPVLGVSWDGTGFGLDGTVWGGEFILVFQGEEGLEWNRVASLRRFRLPGGDRAVKEPRRSALGVLHELRGGCITGLADTPLAGAFDAAETRTLLRMLKRGLNSPQTSSVGRLFDAVAALTGMRRTVRHEGQAAMELEFAAEGAESTETYPLRVGELSSTNDPTQAAVVIDWGELIEGVLADKQHNVPPALISARFHNALTEAIRSVAALVGVTQVALSGGCFQNRRLLERTVDRLRREKFRPYWHQRVPPNDGGIALGQAAALAWKLMLSPSRFSLDRARG